MLYYREISVKRSKKMSSEMRNGRMRRRFGIILATGTAETDFLQRVRTEGRTRWRVMGSNVARAGEPHGDWIYAFVDGILVGSAGNHALSTRETKAPRDFGISILQESRGQGESARGADRRTVDCAKKSRTSAAGPRWSVKMRPQ